MDYYNTLIDKGYSKKTAEIYKSWLNKLQKYYPAKKLEDITLNEIKVYVDGLLTRRNLSPSSRIQAKSTYEFWFNDILNKDYNFNDVVVKRTYKRVIVEYYTEDEILELIASSKTLKARMIISMAYSCGLDVGELEKIKIRDIDFVNGTVKISYKKQKRVRYAVLSETISNDLKLFIKENSLKKWLFEGKQNKKQLSMSGFQWDYHKTLENSSITKGLDFKALKYSYIKHLENSGIPLISIMQELSLSSASTYYAFSVAGVENNPIKITPLDYLQIPKNKSEFETHQLKRQINNLTNKDEREYLIEAVKCLEVGAYRAGVIFIWNFAIRNIHHRLLKHSLNSLNIAIERHFKNARQVKTEDDFSFIKESTVLKAALDMGEFDKNQKKILEDCLNIRNLCSHPGKYDISPIKAMSVIEDIMNIITK